MQPRVLGMSSPAPAVDPNAMVASDTQELPREVPLPASQRLVGVGPFVLCGM